MHAAAGAALALACVAGLSACRGERSDSPPRQFIPDMDDTPKFRNQSQTTFFADGRSMRPRVAGAVAFGDEMNADAANRADFLREDPLVFEGFDPAKPRPDPELPDPAYETNIPEAAIEHWITLANARGNTYTTTDAAGRTRAIIAMTSRGQERFNIYCSACHGYEGEGGDPAGFRGGLVGRRWATPVPSFHDAKYKDRAVKTGKDGYIFHTIRHGVPAADPTKDAPKMPSYADKVNVADSWAIVAYVRALQAARTDASVGKAASNPTSVSTPIAAAPGTTPEVRK